MEADKERAGKFELNKIDISKLGFDLSSDKPYPSSHKDCTRGSFHPLSRIKSDLIRFA